METRKSKQGKTAIIVTIIICVTLVAFAGIAAFIYINQQKLAQEREMQEKAMQLEKEEQEKNRKAEDERSSKQNQAQRYSACKLSGSQICF